jgi:hypothetical protein
LSELSRYFFMAGGLPFIVLGIAHAFLTPHTPEEAKALSPRDASLREAMAKDTLHITRRTTFWRAWVGFNLSHSLGTVLFGVAVLLVGRSEASFQEQGPVFVPFAVVVSTLYLILALRYWFRTPTIGIALSCLCFLTSWVLIR